MRSPHFDGSHGLSIWGQGIFADSTSKSSPTYTVAAVNTFTFTPDLDIKNRFDGGLVGIDYSFGNLAVGVLGGYGKQTGRFKIDANHLNVKGYSIGGYARWQLNGFFVDGLLKYDDYKIRQISNTPAFRIPFDGSTFGGELQVGYHAKVGSAFIEPMVSLSSTRSSIDSFDSAAAGASVDFNRARSLYGNAGVRAGTTIPSGNWTITPFVGGYAQGDLHRRNRVDIAAGPTSLSFQDEHGDANARFEAGIVGKANAGFELSANINGVTGGNTRDIAGRVGLAYHW
jgi:outer membrane autotransporter protein